MLDVRDIRKTYGTPRGPLDVLDGVSLSLASGEAAAIMGPSGSGKSTLLYILGALEPPTSGSVRLDETDPFALPPHELAAFRNRRIGFVFQDHCLLPQCSVLENVLTPTLVGGRSHDLQRARDLVRDVGLGDRIDHRPAELSGGEQQRVAIARALIRQPHLVLCDEPTGNLDRRSADLVADLLLQLHRQHQAILVVVTHSTELASRFPRQFRMRDRSLEEVTAPARDPGER